MASPIDLIITSAEGFTDIDGLACALAYQELSNKEGWKSLVVLPGRLNQSVTKTVKCWGFNFNTEIDNNQVNTVIMDVSEPSHIAKFVDQKRITEIYDHHFGFEDYWKDKLGDKAKIEHVGACATLIWEEFKSRGLDNQISELSANLLYTAIISNTLNFQASVTHQRDIQAFEELKQHINLSTDWIEQYFTELESGIYKDIKQAIIDDTKIQEFPNLGITFVIGQIELWNSQKFVKDNLQLIKSALEGFDNPHWFLTSPSISEGKNYLYADNPQVKKLLTKILNAKFDGDIGMTSKLWLRKEILRKLQEGGDKGTPGNK